MAKKKAPKVAKAPAAPPRPQSNYCVQKKDGLTPRALEVLAVIKAHQQRVTMGPSMRNVAALMGVTQAAIMRHVVALRTQGYIEADNGHGIICSSIKVVLETSPAAEQQHRPAPLSAPRVRAPVLHPNGKL